MANMSYCRFQNTYQDLEDCNEALQWDGLQEYYDNASETEKKYMKKLISLCKDMAEEFHEDLEDLED